MKLDVKTLEATAAGTLDVSDAIFGLEPRADIIHRVVNWQLNKRQQGTHQAKSRGERERRSIPMSAFEPRDPGSDRPAVDPSRFRPSSDARWPGHWAEPPADWGSDAEGRLLGRETQDVISSAMDTLAPAQRLVMPLRDLEGWDSDEVCAALEISPGNQRVLLHRARSRVRAALERYFHEATLV